MSTLVEERARDVRERAREVGKAAVDVGSALVELAKALAAQGRAFAGRSEAEGARVVRQVGDKTEDTAARRETTRYEQMTVEELQQIAADRGIQGRSAMKKAELVKALRS